MVFVPGLNIKCEEGWERLADTPEEEQNDKYIQTES
jgi:hypothetical protein